MAEQNLAEQPEEQEEVPAEETAAPPRPPLIPAVVVRIAVLAGILAALSVGALFLVTDVLAPKIRSMGEPAVDEPAAREPEPGLPGEIVKVEDLIVNPAGTAGRRYLKVAAAIEVHEAKAIKELEAREAQVRDLFLRELSARTLEELTDPTAKEEMRQAIVSELDAIVGAGKVTNLYFTEYVVQ
jgi:flagellar FliL protein